MSHHTRVPYFPENLEEYAPWVATHGLLAPYGKCQCGCGQAAPLAHKTYVKFGRHEGQPVRYIKGHNGRYFDDSPAGYKRCTRCGTIRSLTEYYSDGDGVTAYCKDCARARSKAYNRANRDKLLRKTTAYRRENREKLSARERERRADSTYRKKCAVKLKKWRERNREYVSAYNRGDAVRARGAINKAVLRGDFPPPASMVCEGCQEAQAQHYHHPQGYAKEHWLDVIALCTECHGKAHWVEA